jgi:hypothetical protein
MMETSMIHHDWTHAEVAELLDRPFHDLLADAHRVHSDRFDPNEIEGASLLSIKTGGCSEDCAYCPQSARHQTGLESQALLSTDEIVSAARDAKAAGASRFCMGAAWRSPTDRQVDAVADAVREVAALELQTCATLGMLTEGQAAALATAGLDYYNHNLDTSPEFYGGCIACCRGMLRPASGPEDHHRSMGAPGTPVAGLGSNCLLRPERCPQMRVAAESLAIYTAVVVGSSPAGPTHIKAGQSPEASGPRRSAARVAG